MDLTNFYEPLGEKPILQNAIVESSKGGKYRVDRWFSAKGHCYVFNDISLNSNKPSFAQRPSQVAKAIKTNKIKIIKHGTESVWN